MSLRWVCLFMALIPFSSQASAPPSSVFSNHQGIEELKKNNPTAAQNHFLQSLSENPFEARLHLNLGLTFELLGQMDKAQASYETALKAAQDVDLRFAANYNLGELAQKAKKTDEALRFYQEALKDRPDSKETKTNIELLIQDQQEQQKNKDQNQDSKDKKDQNKDGKGENKDPNQDSKDSPKDDSQKQEKDQPKQYGKNKPQPRKFKSEELSQGDVNKILGEIKQQEQKIRAEFNKKEVKDRPRDKDW